MDVSEADWHQIADGVLQEQMKKKLLFINGHLNTGGVEKSLLDVLQHLDYDKYDVDLLLLEELGDYASELPSQVHVDLRCLKNTYGSVQKSLVRCIREKDWFCFWMRLIFLWMKLRGQRKIALANRLLTDRKHYNCVIGFRSGICTQIAAWAVNADRRITWWHHGEINVDLIAYQETAAACDQVAVVSNACCQMLSEQIPGISGKLTVVPNMLDVSAVQEKAEAFIPYPDQGLVQIVSVGRLSPEKHFENAIATAGTLKQVGIAFQWHLVGEGCLHQQLLQQIRDAGVEDCFILEGNQPNPYPYMQHADLFVHPSYVESQGIVVMEAMALGVPCVVTSSLGPCEFVEDGVNGILTEQNPESLSEKVMEILNDPVLYQKIKQNTSCPEQFLPERVMKQVEALL